MSLTDSQVDMTCLDSILAQARPVLDPVLERMPGTLLEARRLITREFGFEPRPEELQLIVKLAAEGSGPGIRRVLPRQMLAVRVAVERALKDFWEAPLVDAGRLRAVSDAIPELLQAAREISTRFPALIHGEALDPADRHLLNQVAATLQPPEEQLVAVSVLSSRLVELAVASEQGRTAELASLSREEVTWLAGTLADGAAGPSRACVDAVAMRTLLDDEYAFWSEAIEGPTAGEADSARRASAQSFQRNETAYRVVCDRLQNQQDEAASAGLASFGDDMRRIRGDLFSSYRRLATLVRAGAPGEDALNEEQATRLREKVRRAEQEARQTVATSQVVQEAAANVDTPVVVAPPDPGRNPQRGRRIRVVLLAAAAVILLPVTVEVRRSLPEPPPPQIRIDPSDFSQVAILEDTLPTGNLLCSRISSWRELSEEEQLRRVNALGRRAHEHGFEALVVVDAQDLQVAEWSSGKGGRLIDNPDR